MGGKRSRDLSSGVWCVMIPKKLLMLLLDLWICEFWIPREQRRLVVTGDAAILYPTSLRKRNGYLQKIYPVMATSRETAQQLKFTVLLDR
jgi:hypothetical protein